MLIAYNVMSTCTGTSILLVAYISRLDWTLGTLYTCTLYMYNVGVPEQVLGWFTRAPQLVLGLRVVGQIQKPSLYIAEQNQYKLL